MNNLKLEMLINNKLNSLKIEDFVINGLQIEGKKEINKIVTGVTACQELLDNSVKNQVDAIIVHHGFFWKNESPKVYGIKRYRIKTILINDINLYAWHIPLDIHPVIGNNAQLANYLSISILGYLNPMVPYGKYDNYISPRDLYLKLKCFSGKSVIHFKENAPSKIKKIAWCSGRGQNFIELACLHGMHAFISGESSEQTMHIAKEYGIHFYAIGHHVSERGGIKMLGEWLKREYALDVTFVDIFNPI